MPSQFAPRPRQPAVGDPAPGRAPAMLATLSYRSVAVRPFSDTDLQQMLVVARVRNRAEGVTGLLIHDEGRFFQWLEGPPEGVARIWQAIREDPRHAQIEVLGGASSPLRFFADWDMKFQADRRLDDDAAPAPAAGDPRLPGLAPVWPLADAGALRQVVDESVLPQLATRLGRGPARFAPAVNAAPHNDLAQLARLLVAADPVQALAMLDRLQAAAHDLGALCAEVTEPTARCLGDLWSADDCSDVELTLGLSRLQTAFRHHCRAMPEAAPAGLPWRAVLVAPQPGEQHMLGAVLDAELLWRAGWDTHCEFPGSDAALQGMLADSWFDALDLSPSVALRRDHGLLRLADTIRGARRASRNPALVISVGGRGVAERPSLLAACAADALVASARSVVFQLGHQLSARQLA